MKQDYHIHSEFSIDSNIKINDLIPLAIQRGYKRIAITEHLDLLPQEIVHNDLLPLNNYIKFIDDLKVKQRDLEIYCGLELGDYHLVKNAVDNALHNMNMDILLGSVHFLSDGTNVAIPIPHLLTKSEIYDYYKQNLFLVESCDFDVLAHLGVYKRYYRTMPDESQCHNIIDHIFQVMIKKNIALEINYSSFRKTYQSVLPEPHYLQRYKYFGGKIVTIGSDSHQLSHFDDYYVRAYDCINQFDFQLL